MNTLTNQDPYLSTENYRDNVILLEELEFAMPKEQLKRITELHNKGVRLEDIAEQVKRNYYEVLLAIIHQVKHGYKMRPIAFRKKVKS
ncbi:hypothetical protein ACW2QC_09215 [Virgibacillus sp. FSP13]